LSAPGKEDTGRYADHAEYIPTVHAASQAEGLRALLSLAVNRAGELIEETAVRDELALSVLENVVPEPDLAELAPDLTAFSPPELIPQERADSPPRSGRTANRGRHAATPPPYLERRGARFVVFSAIGGFVFLMGLGLQAALTGGLDMRPVVSYTIQAVVSVETSFLLNRWLTWRDRGTRFWLAFARFNAQKAVTIALNLALYAGLLRLGMNYLVANIALTAVFTLVNYVAGDRLVFIPLRTRSTKPATPPVAAPGNRPVKPWVSVVIPCRDNEHTIGAAVRSLLDQDYSQLFEIILIGSIADRTWSGVADLNDPRLAIYETETPPGMRDANFKRDAAIRMASGDLIALIDSDIVLPRDWMTRAVAALVKSDASCVAGGMKSVHDSFWGRYTDSTWIGAKTPRIAQSYTVTSADFGMRGRKPPITANALFTRDLYEHCPIDSSWSHGSYEDYEWFWRVTKAGYRVLVCSELFGWHHHRRGLRALVKEYRRSSRGCAYFIRAHRDCPFARRRLRQLVILPLTATAAVCAAGAAVATGHSTALAAFVLGCAGVLAVHQIARSRSLKSLAYPLLGLFLGCVFITGLATNLITSSRAPGGSASSPSLTPVAEMRQSHRQSRSRLLYPLTAICSVQAGLSLTLVWSNTAYIDEANFLWIGRLELGHWLHGASWPSTYAFRFLPGSPTVYPPLGALADRLGGLAGARILSLAFMLGTTVLLCLTAHRLIGRRGALIAAALFALSEPVMRMTFASSDALSIFLTALSAWLVVQAACRKRRGELIVIAAVVLGLANTATYWGLLIDPVVIAFAFLALLQRMSWQQALSCAAWLAAAWALCFGLLMTATHAWLGLFSTMFESQSDAYQGISPTIGQAWAYTSLIIGLALIGAAISLQSNGRNHAALVGGLSFGIVMLVQIRNQTPWSIDKHLAYGIWFAAIAAGYACNKLICKFPVSKRSFAILCCAVAFVYPAATSWQLAWQRYHAWPNANSFIDSFRTVAAHSQGPLYLPAHVANIAEYYAPQVSDWTRWNASLSFNPSGIPQNSWESYYSTQIRERNYSLVALFYSTTFSEVKLPGTILLSSRASYTYQRLLGLVGENSGEPGLPALTQALEKDYQYHIVAVGHYNTSNISGTHAYGVYAIWMKEHS
jgi:putative flippase GtrA/GT2 family glycosyltransferase